MLRSIRRLLAKCSYDFLKWCFAFFWSVILLHGKSSNANFEWFLYVTLPGILLIFSGIHTFWDISVGITFRKKHEMKIACRFSIKNNFPISTVTAMDFFTQCRRKIFYDVQIRCNVTLKTLMNRTHRNNNKTENTYIPHDIFS